jgi:hypothetical protein
MPLMPKRAFLERTQVNDQRANEANRKLFQLRALDFLVWAVAARTPRMRCNPALL